MDGFWIWASISLLHGSIFVKNHSPIPNWNHGSSEGISIRNFLDKCWKFYPDEFRKNQKSAKQITEFSKFGQLSCFQSKDIQNQNFSSLPGCFKVLVLYDTKSSFLASEISIGFATLSS
jgi:hypothetical protein